ncbi:MAG: hypothetical protein MI919_20000 [Holophagales bacterium]|nr:hypothetical protein [Holophagales bacterium]
MNLSRSLLLAICAALLLLPAVPAAAAGGGLTPVVIFPAYHFNVLEVWVLGQTRFPECPAWGVYEVWFPNPNPSASFSQECQDKLMSLVVDPDSSKPMAERFSNQPRVLVLQKHYSRTESSPSYEPMYAFLESHGWERNKNIRVAGYDGRLTPDMNGFVASTKLLIEATYYLNGGTPVHLVGHSNGPLYMQYLLTHTSQAWKDKFIHGITPIAGNWAGQGLFYTVYFTGLNLTDFSFPGDAGTAKASATRYATQPSSYMSTADPDYFQNQEIILRDASTGTDYTPMDALQLFDDAGLPVAEELAAHYLGFVEFLPPAYPNVDVYAEKGSGIPTPVGIEVPSLDVGYVYEDGVTPLFMDVGDGNQEQLTNDAVEVWQTMPCFRFEMTDNVGVDHFAIVSDPGVLARLVTNLGRSRSVCP